MLEFLRLPRVVAAIGKSRSQLYLDISNGIFPSAVSLGGGRPVGWPAHEVAAINAAHLSGASRDDMKRLVSAIVSTRSDPDPEQSVRKLIEDLTAVRRSAA